MNEKSNTFLETEPIGALMRKYAVPCIISLLVAALYNIVDQIFIANASYFNLILRYTANRYEHQKCEN